MMGDNKSEKFFKVLHDRMKEAQTDIKATVSVNVGEMTHKANEKELDNGESLLVHLTTDGLSVLQTRSVHPNPPPPTVQVATQHWSFLVQEVTRCWSRASPSPPSQAPLPCRSSQQQSSGRWTRRWDQLSPS